MPQQDIASLIRMIALFLAEVIRSRRTSLKRAAEISRRVIAMIPGIRTEGQALGALTQIEKDFEEVVVLKQALHFGYQESDTRVYEKEIREYASRVFSEDMVLSSAFLQDAASPGMTIQKLCMRYPQFCQHITVSGKNARLEAVMAS